MREWAREGARGGRHHSLLRSCEGDRLTEWGRAARARGFGASPHAGAADGTWGDWLQTFWGWGFLVRL